MGKGCLSLFLGWGVGCRNQWEQKSPWSWGRRGVAGRNRQAPSGLLFWAREFKQALNLNGEKSSPPRSPPKEALHFPVRGAKSGCGCPAGLRPCFPTQLSLRARPGHPAAGVGGSALARPPALPGTLSLDRVLSPPSSSLLSLRLNSFPAVPTGTVSSGDEGLAPTSEDPSSVSSEQPGVTAPGMWALRERDGPYIAGPVALQEWASSASACHTKG